MVMPPSSRVTWQYHRLINSAYPPIDLFEDIADPADWELLAAAESKTNPRVAETIGNLDSVPPEHRVSGAGASYVMAPFVHASEDKPGRFNDGTYGAFYGANEYETALFETIHHTGQFCAATNEVPGWIADMRELVGDIDADLVDIRDGGFDDLLAPDDYTSSQAFARTTRDAGDNGIVYPSVRHRGGECFATFLPNVMGIPIQGRHITYHWDGNRIDMIQDVSDDNKVYEIEM